MKRVFAIMLALVMVLSMSITAFAADGTGSITITNATNGQTYNIYKIFDATYSDEDGTKAVAYSVEKDTPAYNAVTSEEGQKFFNYSAETGNVSKKEGVNDSELITYLTNLVKAEGSGFTAAQSAVTASSETVQFTGLEYGYYLITSTLGTAVTINSNTPDVSVIDKNQKPGGTFDKSIVENGEEVDHNTAAYGDTVDYKIELATTNYDGDKHILYYQIIDTVGSSLAIDWSSFKLSIGGVQKEKGWLLNNYGTTDEVQEGPLSDTGYTKDQADWYLVYLGNNKFRITMPWQTNHTIEGNTPGSYTIKFAEGVTHESKYESPSNIELTYSVKVKSGAVVGGGDVAELKNTANGSWTSTYETDTTPTDFVYTEVFGLAILKDDLATGKNLADAKFKVWKDAACTQAVPVVGAGIEGVYKLAIEGETGSNEVVTPINGKIVIQGLDAGKYYLQETEAPDGYNALTAPVELEVGSGQTPFYVFADTNGKVADLRDPDATHSRNTYNVTHTVVHNSKGLELPSTGGEGTMLLITFGSILTMAFAVLLITQKKMSIYKD